MSRDHVLLVSHRKIIIMIQNVNVKNGIMQDHVSKFWPLLKGIIFELHYTDTEYLDTSLTAVMRLLDYSLW